MDLKMVQIMEEAIIAAVALLRTSAWGAMKQSWNGRHIEELPSQVCMTKQRLGYFPLGPCDGEYQKSGLRVDSISYANIFIAYQETKSG